jgi:hypothetical protein
MAATIKLAEIAFAITAGDRVPCNISMCFVIFFR